jgi:hypothetical protein
MKEQQTSPIVEDGKILKHTDNNGEVVEYYPASFKTLYVDLRSIALGSSVSSHREPEERLQLRRLVTGIGRIQDRGFSVIGDPANKTSELAVTINCRSVDEERAFLEELAKEEGDRTGAAYNARVGFIAADWEIGNVDSWYLTIEIAAPLFTDLVESIYRNDIASFTIGVSFSRGAYIRNKYFVQSDRIDWFLRPDANRERSAKGAAGHVSVWRINNLPKKIVGSEAAGIDAEVPTNGNGSGRDAMSGQAESVQLNQLTIAVNHLAVTNRFVGWIVAVAIVAAAVIIATWLKGPPPH